MVYVFEANIIMIYSFIIKKDAKKRPNVTLIIKYFVMNYSGCMWIYYQVYTCTYNFDD